MHGHVNDLKDVARRGVIWMPTSMDFPNRDAPKWSIRKGIQGLCKYRIDGSTL